jgi:sarcosine oxidase subunit alpha
MARNNNIQRMAEQPTELIDRNDGVEFQFDGKRINAFTGDTVASALHVAGVSILSRSFKYHRPRGLLCGAGQCPNCLVNVDGVPNVRACTQQVRPGMNVRHQNAWPSLNLDFLSILDRMQWLMPVGFYYKALHRPKFLWGLAQRVIRRVGGLGKIDINQVPDTDYHHRYHHADVAVVGGGPAGLAAASAAADYGAKVTLIDDQASLGGHLRFDSGNHSGLPDLADGSGQELAIRLAGEAHRSPNIEILSSATVLAHYQDNLLTILHGNELVKLRAKRVVLATGSYEVPIQFQNNDRPGIMLATAAQRLIHLYGIKPGNTAVVATANDQGYQAALDLMNAGVEVAAVVDARPGHSDGLEAAASLISQGVQLLADCNVTRATGKNRVNAVFVSSQSGNGAGRRIACDLVCMSGGFQPANALLQHSGGSLEYDENSGEGLPRNLPDGVYVAGEVSGIHDLPSSLLQGSIAGLEAATLVTGDGSLQAKLPKLDQAKQQLAALEHQPGTHSASPVSDKNLVSDKNPGKKSFICFCEDVTVKDIAQAVEEGFDDIQILKRYSTATMGPCQGKMCLKALTGLCAQYTGRTIGDTGGTTARPPVQPVPLAALAGPSHMPVKRTPMDQNHRDLGAAMVDLGPWQRAHSYGSPQDECLAVRQRVGIIDVTTLGKLEVVGQGAGALLDRVYTHHFSNLPVGRIRYGLLCTDNSTIMDDGTVTRLSEDRFFVTTTTGNVDVIEEWFKWWSTGSGACAHITNVTSAYAAVNLAGPRARETLSKLTDIDLSTKSFRYMRSAQGTVAGVPAILLRIGFVGETGWEIHVPAEYGQYIWETIMEAGKEFGIAPFGLEAQRILRLEKKHVIVGQDTDAVSNPLDSDMDWVVRFDKEDFIGRGGLKLASERGLPNKLVGFVMSNGQVPEDGVPVVSGNKPIGKVTSARFSPTMKKGFGIAWVPVELAQDGTQISILVRGKPQPAQVTLQPFYDPAGERLRQ